MEKTPFPDAVLVATDFSPSAGRALDIALGWRSAKTEVTVLHVVDTQLAARAERLGVASAQTAITKMRELADRELAGIQREYAGEAFETMLVEGIPFVEIVRVATDLLTSLVILGCHGSHASLEGVLFGTTAEKVVRSCRTPVLCVP